MTRPQKNGCIRKFATDVCATTGELQDVLLGEDVVSAVVIGLRPTWFSAAGEGLEHAEGLLGLGVALFGANGQFGLDAGHHFLDSEGLVDGEGWV